WMDLKVAFSGSDVQTALESCEYGEDNALKTYKKALEEDANWPAETMNLISNQRQSLKVSHDRIKRYRDEHAAKSSTVSH
ncbi:MAG TPA: aldehyde dehydrogenase, partial [Cyclobacteriaceae bacterium]